MTFPSRHPMRRRQNGVVAIEFALVFLIFFAIFYAIAGFGLILVGQQSLTLAAEEGARAALRHPGPGNDVNQRLANAKAAADSALIWLPAAGREASTAVAESCGYANLTCVRVQVRYNYGASPLIPNLPFFNLIFPATLDSTAVMQLGSNG